MNAWLAGVKDGRKETTAYLEGNEAYPEKMEVNPEEMKSVAEIPKVPKEEGAVKPVKAMKKRNKGRYLDARRHGKAKERTKGNGRCRKKLAVACSRMTRSAGVKRRKGHGRRNVAPKN
jgi:hypothetical protein